MPFSVTTKVVNIYSLTRFVIGVKQLLAYANISEVSPHSRLSVGLPTSNLDLDMYRSKYVILVFIFISLGF